MKEFNMVGLRENLEQFSTEELDAMLQGELEREDPDPASVKLLMDILENRNTGNQEISPGKEAAWQRYQERIDKLRKAPSQSRKWIARAASVILIAGTLFAFVPQEVGAESLWDVFVRWVNDAIEFFDSKDRKIEVPFVFTTDNPGLQKIYDEAIAMGIDRPLIPMWFPEEKTLSVIEITNTPRGDNLYAVFSDEDEESIFQINISEADELHGYFGEKEYEKYFERESAKYRITRNNDYWIAVWTIDKTEYSVAMDWQEDTLERILDSIYVMEE